MRILYPLTASLALASAVSIPHPKAVTGVAVRDVTFANAGLHDSGYEGLASRFAQFLKRYLQKPSTISDKPEYGPPAKDDIPSTAGRPGKGFDKLDADHQKYVEDYLDTAPKAEQVRMDVKWLKQGEEASEGQTAMMQDQDGHFHMWYGSNDEDGRMKFHGMSKAYSMAANGIDPKKGLTLRYKFADDPDNEDEPSRGDVFFRAPKPTRSDETAPVLEEAPMQMLQRQGFHVTLTLVPDGESRQEGSMTSSVGTKVRKQQEEWNEEFDKKVQQAKDNKEDPPSEDERKRVQITYYDNRAQDVRDQMDKDLRDGKLKLYRGPVVKDWPGPGDAIVPMLYYGVKGISPDKYWNKDGESDAETEKSDDVISIDVPLTRPAPSRGGSENQPPKKKTKAGLVDVKGGSTQQGSQSGSQQGSQKRGLYRSRFASPPLIFGRDIADQIKNDTQNENDPTEVAKMEYDDLNLGFTATRNNVSILIWPIIQELMESSDSVLIHDMALSIWAQLTRAPLSIGGPYSFGTTRFYDLQQQANQDSNFSDADKQETNYVIDKLEYIYQQAWANATAAANQFGGLDFLDRIADRLNPVNASIIPPEDSNPDSSAVNIFGAFNPPENSVITLSDWEKLWADSGEANGTMIGNGTAANGNSTTTPYGNGTSSTNSTLKRRSRRGVVLPTYTMHR